MKTRIDKGRPRVDKKDKIKIGGDIINYRKGVAIIAAGIDGYTVYVHKETNVWLKLTILGPNPPVR